MRCFRLRLPESGLAVSTCMATSMHMSPTRKERHYFLLILFGCHPTTCSSFPTTVSRYFFTFTMSNHFTLAGPLFDESDDDHMGIAVLAVHSFDEFS